MSSSSKAPAILLDNMPKNTAPDKNATSRFVHRSRLRILTIPALKDNYSYIVVNTDNNTAVVIDPSEAPPVIQALEENRLKLKAILNTHHHHDHIGGNSELVRKYGVSVLCSANDLMRVPHATRGLSEGMTVELLGETWCILEIPGHTMGQIAFHIPDEKAVFVGDTLFAMGCGRLFEGTAEQMWNSLCHLMRLPSDTRIYFGHEYTEKNAQFATHVDPENSEISRRLDQALREVASLGYSRPPTIEEEKRVNPFLRPAAPEIKSQLGLSRAGEIEVFAKLRQMRDSF